MGIEAGIESTLRVAVQAEGYEPLEHDVTLQPDAAWPVLELTLVRARAESSERDTATDGRLPAGFVGPGLVSWWFGIPEHDGANTAVCRGVPVTCGGHAAGVAVVDAEGRFRLDGPWPHYALCLQRPGSPPAWFRPVKDGPETHAAATTGAIRGCVTGMQAEALPHAHVVVFGRGVLRRTAHVRDDGTFDLRDVPAGTYWLRVGDDDFDRVREKLVQPLGLADHAALARASLGAVEVTVRAGEVASDVELAAD